VPPSSGSTPALSAALPPAATAASCWPGSAEAHHVVVAQLGREQAARLYALTLDELGRIAEQTPAAVRRVGSLRIEDDEAGQRDCAEQAAALRADGFAVEEYDGAEGRGLLFPQDAAMQPLLRCRLLAQQLLLRGARLFEHSAAADIAQGRVLTAHGRIHCDAVVVAVDGPPRPAAARARRRRSHGAPADARHRTHRRDPGPAAGVPARRPRVLAAATRRAARRRRVRDLGGGLEETTSVEPAEPVQSALERLLRDRLRVSPP
jgi:hypothetical protein